MPARQPATDVHDACPMSKSGLATDVYGAGHFLAAREPARKADALDAGPLCRGGESQLMLMMLAICPQMMLMVLARFASIQERGRS